MPETDRARTQLIGMTRGWEWGESVRPAHRVSRPRRAFRILEDVPGDHLPRPEIEHAVDRRRDRSVSGQAWQLEDILDKAKHGAEVVQVVVDEMLARVGRDDDQRNADAECEIIERPREDARFPGSPG